MNEFTSVLKALEELMNKKYQGDNIKLTWGIIGNTVTVYQLADYPKEHKRLLSNTNDKALMLDVLNYIKLLVEELYV